MFFFRYLSLLKTSKKFVVSRRRVIAMSLFGNKPRQMYGAIRNIQLQRLFLPSWSVRVYIPPVTSSLAVPPIVANKLRSLGADVIETQPPLSKLDPKLWRYDVTRDVRVARFLILDADSRIDEHFANFINLWSSKKRRRKSSERSYHDVVCVLKCNQTNNTHTNNIRGSPCNRRKKIIVHTTITMGLILKLKIYNNFNINS